MHTSNLLSEVVSIPVAAKTPAIRYVEFRDAWEQRKLGDVTKTYSGGTPSVGRSEYYGGHIPFIRSAEINCSSTELLLTESGLANSSAKMVDTGDILYALYGATSGEVGIAQIQGAINQAILAIKPDDGYDAQFIMQWLRSQKQKIIDKYLQGGQGNLSASLVEDLLVKFPESDEQQQVGKFFSAIDRLISLHRREHDKTVNIKKAMLEKMFPKDGADKPEIRFAGFTDAWERLSFDKLFDPIPNNTLSRADLNYETGKVKNIHYGDILIKYGAVTDCRIDEIPFITGGDVSDFKGQLLLDGDVLFADTAEDETVGKATEICGIGDDFVVSGLHTMAYRPKEKIAANYLGYYLNSTSYHHQLFSLMQGVKVLSISRRNLGKTLVSYPASEQEQSEIGATFVAIDSLISLHRRELEKLQNMKKALLEKMFV